MTTPLTEAQRAVETLLAAHWDTGCRLCEPASLAVIWRAPWLALDLRGPEPCRVGQALTRLIEALTALDAPQGVS